jgi:hypothetical protein
MMIYDLILHGFAGALCHPDQGGGILFCATHCPIIMSISGSFSSLSEMK